MPAAEPKHLRKPHRRDFSFSRRSAAVVVPLLLLAVGVGISATGNTSSSPGSTPVSGELRLSTTMPGAQVLGTVIVRSPAEQSAVTAPAEADTTTTSKPSPVTSTTAVQKIVSCNDHYVEVDRPGTNHDDGSPRPFQVNHLQRRLEYR